MCITLCARGTGRIPIANVNSLLFDFKDQLRSGRSAWLELLAPLSDCSVVLSMWLGEKANPIGTCVENVSAPGAIKISLQFAKFPQPGTPLHCSYGCILWFFSNDIYSLIIFQSFIQHWNLRNLLFSRKYPQRMSIRS